MSKRWLAVIAWMLVILYLSTKRATADYGSTLPSLVHFVEYGILAVLVRLALAATLPFGAFILDAVAVLWSVVYGGLMEVAQAFVPTRQADIYDAIVNMLGALVAVAVGRVLFPRWLKARGRS